MDLSQTSDLAPSPKEPVNDFPLFLSPSPSLSLSKRVFHGLHEAMRRCRLNSTDTDTDTDTGDKVVGRLRLKEFTEAHQFMLKFQGTLKRSIAKDFQTPPITVIDCCGGHGCLAYWALLLLNCSGAVVIDPAECKSGKKVLEETFSPFLGTGKHVRYDNGRIEDRLSTVIAENGGPENVFIVGLHCCSWLSKEIFRIASKENVRVVAVMPCCQKDFTGGSWKTFAKSSGTQFGVTSDLLLAGWLEGRGYQVRMKLIDEEVTPQNRLIVGWRDYNEKTTAVDEHKKKLKIAYDRAHNVDNVDNVDNKNVVETPRILESEDSVERMKNVESELDDSVAQKQVQSEELRQRYKGPKVEDMNNEQKEIYEEIRRTRTTGAAGPFGPWLANPSVANYWQKLGRTCRYDLSNFGLKKSELAILVVAAGTCAQAEWDIHEGEARKAGVDESVIAALKATWGGKGLVKRDVFAADDEWAIYKFVEELCRERTVGDDNYWDLQQLLGDVAVVELVSLVGYYNFVSMTLRTFQIKAPTTVDENQQHN